GGRRKSQAEGGQTINLSERISKLHPEPVAYQDKSTSDFLSADFADERRWGESQRRSVAWFDWRIQQSLRSRFVEAPTTCSLHLHWPLATVGVGRGDYLGEPSGAAIDAACRAGHPWTEQMDRTMSRNVWKTRSSSSQKRPGLTGHSPLAAPLPPDSLTTVLPPLVTTTPCRRPEIGFVFPARFRVYSFYVAICQRLTPRAIGFVRHRPKTGQIRVFQLDTWQAFARFLLIRRGGGPAEWE